VLPLPFLNPLTNEGAFASISCASSSVCVAVGNALEEPTDDYSVPLMATDLGGAWSTSLDDTSLKVAFGTANYSAFELVSCGSPSSCFATGYGHRALSGTEFWSSIVPTQVVRAPGKPQDVGVTWGTRVTRVNFSPPNSDGGSRVTLFTVRARSPGEVTRSCTTPGLRCSFKGTVKGKTYWVTVTAQNAKGTSAPSNPLTFVAD
jgi:hypothetical protein